MPHGNSMDYSVEGDFYAVPDDVMRGIAIAPASLHASAFGDAFGDWPGMSEAECCGAKAHGAPSGAFDSLDVLAPLHGEWPHCPAIAPGMLAAGAGRLRSGPGTPEPQGLHRFQAGDVPPAVPLDPLFRLESTTIVIDGSSSADAAALGNGLLEHLRTEASAKVRKVSRPKFSVKAHASCGDLSCELKARLYRQKDGSCAVEFQRRSGDSIAFGGVFRRAADHLLAAGIQPRVRPDAAVRGLSCPGTPARVSTPVRGSA